MPKLSAALTDTTSDGINGLNIDLVAPFVYNDYIFGFKYGLGNLEKLPQFLFAKKVFKTSNGDISLDADFTVDDKVLAVKSEWYNKDLGLSIGVNGNSKQPFTGVNFFKDGIINGKKVRLSTAYDIVKKNVKGIVTSQVKGIATLQVDANKLAVRFDGKNPFFSITNAIDRQTEITPVINLSTGNVHCEFFHKWSGGSLKSVLFPGSKVELQWKDTGVGGSWTTTANLPLNEAAGKPKISISRDWSF
eukprot:CAMPEP_0170063258 /NCGR_PEP_ID=MMETSP0019_2-20121128/4196_1 /TAXON_ID=98059 /ORGANISM="Dinobryon sp., Strain UTEXLB2267" /LENGTH=246 /DNA_ID=CAMNT_0010269649 /DNA_START=77 /DNA_END=817 /DNA_ORIENTATION=-